MHTPRARTHTHTHTHTHTRARACTYHASVRAHTHAHTHGRTRMYTPRTHTHTHVRTHAHPPPPHTHTGGGGGREKEDLRSTNRDFSLLFLKVICLNFHPLFVCVYFFVTVMTKDNGSQRYPNLFLSERPISDVNEIMISDKVCRFPQHWLCCDVMGAFPVL